MKAHTWRVWMDDRACCMWDPLSPQRIHLVEGRALCHCHPWRPLSLLWGSHRRNSPPHYRSIRGIFFLRLLCRCSNRRLDTPALQAWYHTHFCKLHCRRQQVRGGFSVRKSSVRFRWVWWMNCGRCASSSRSNFYRCGNCRSQWMKRRQRAQLNASLIYLFIYNSRVRTNNVKQV